MSSYDPDMKPIKTAIVGYGKSAKVFHLPYLAFMPEFEIVAFVSSQKESIKKDFPNQIIYDSVEELAQNPEIELVVLCSPTFLHHSQALTLLKAKKHLVVEKPFTVTHQEAQELVDVAQSLNLKLSVYHNRRWDSPFLTLKKLIAEEKLGEIFHYEVHFDRWRPNVQDRWRDKNIPGSGILYDLGSHMIDQIICLFGEPEEIIADLDSQRKEAGAIDYFHLIFKYKKMRAILHSSSLVQAPREHLVVHGSKASFVHKDMDSQESQLMNGKNLLNIHKQNSSQLFFQDGANTLMEPISSVPGSYENFYLLMSKAIIEDHELPVDPKSVVKCIKILEDIETLSTDLQKSK